MRNRPVFLLFAALLAAAVVCLGCRRSPAPPERRTGAALTPATSPQDSMNVVLTNQVSHVDASVLGWDEPLRVAVAGTVDGGSASNVAIVNDAGNPVPVAQQGVAQVDQTVQDELNTFVSQNVPSTTGQILIDAGTRCILDVNFTNYSSTTGEADIFCGQYVLDAGGTAAAATAPNLQLHCPGGNICGIQLKAPLCCAGAAWYPSADAGFLVTASAPALTLTSAALR